MPLHTHWPLTHDSPLPHEGPLPHVQLPPVQESAVVVSQIAQVPPLVPQVASVADWHALALQQPFGHEVELQTH